MKTILVGSLSPEKTTKNRLAIRNSEPLKTSKAPLPMEFSSSWKPLRMEAFTLNPLELELEPLVETLIWFAGTFTCHFPLFAAAYSLYSEWLSFLFCFMLFHPFLTFT